MIRWLVNYIRQCRCKHEWVKEEAVARYRDSFGGIRNVRVVMTCKKCGWRKKYWKY